MPHALRTREAFVRPLARCAVPLAAIVLPAISACGPGTPFAADEPPAAPALATAALSSYFPPSEAAGGWRTTRDSAQILSLGMDAGKLAGLGSYLMALPYETYKTGVSGYDFTSKAALVIKNGWVVGEYYNQPSAATAVYYLASNGKTITIMLLGRMVQDYPGVAFGLGSRLYDQRWLPEGFPLTDPRKADITIDQVFRHVSGIIPEAEDQIASGSVQTESAWNFAPFTVGKDPDYPVSAPLYFTPGDSSTYARGRPYSSVAFNHFSLVFRNVSGLEPSAYLRKGLLDPIGVGRMAYKRPAGMGDFVWATAGNGLASARDFARLGYLMLHEGDWAGTRLFAAAWLRNFTTSAAYPNIRSNVDCHWGAKYPSDMYRTTGSGQNWALVVPSLDLVVTFNGRTPATLAAQVDTASLSRLFAAVTERYVACDGTIVNDTTGISLSAAGRKRGGFEFVDLRWSGAAGTNVDVYRNGARLVTVANSGAWTDATGKKGARSLTYRVCLAGTGTCSTSVTVTF
jgi:CubicO group peptidase (beta-lactamase class C family)